MSVLFWVLLAIGLAVVEIVSLTFFSIFFTISALLALVAVAFDLGAGWQWGIFGIGGLVLSAALRPIAKRQVDKGPTLRSGVEELVGRGGVVSVAIDGHAGVGAVNVDGQVWSAKADPAVGGGFAVGDDVRILEVRGATLVVAPNRTGVR